MLFIIYVQKINFITRRKVVNNVIRILHSFRPRYGPGVDSAFNRNQYNNIFKGIKAAGA
jgi:hypothetical protein